MEPRILCVFAVTFTVLKADYPPIGDEVVPGSVLLPATRRGRYLANIIRRQAIDGTGIKFNKDADRMNAEAKKKVDVLSDELLPYIIAEQERRMTLYQRMMTAVKTGERGITIAEISGLGRPPIVIKRGVLYRCPSNRVPIEPDGSGVIGCSQNAVISQVKYDACLSAEDAPLYVSNEQYFFCNRYRMSLGDLPRDRNTTFVCTPNERTPLNYTSWKCTPEHINDVIVHYRYYPDRTYKTVSELDPDREVCEHWAPCQIGYIFGLPPLSSALQATDIFPQFVEEDSLEEFVDVEAKNYTTSPRRIRLLSGVTTCSGVYLETPSGQIVQLESSQYEVTPVRKCNKSQGGHFIAVTLQFLKIPTPFHGTYYAVFKKPGTENEIKRPIVKIEPTTVRVVPVELYRMIGERSSNDSLVQYTCERCQLERIMRRGEDDTVANLNLKQYSVRDISRIRKEIAISFPEITQEDLGDYFMLMQDANGLEERVKIASVRGDLIQVKTAAVSAKPGDPVASMVQYSCEDCTIDAIICSGTEAAKEPDIRHIPDGKLVSFNMRFTEKMACVYTGLFRIKSKIYSKVLAVFENASPEVKVTPHPHESVSVKETEPFKRELKFECKKCRVDTVRVNGQPSDKYKVVDKKIMIDIASVSRRDVGVYQAVFSSGKNTITKNLLELKLAIDPAGGDKAGTTEATGGPKTEGAGDAATEAANSGTTATGNVDATTATPNATTTVADAVTTTAAADATTTAAAGAATTMADATTTEAGAVTTEAAATTTAAA